jgi:cation diffusion facilitator CzcD-associated flavoprotein CzcO
MRIPAGLTQDVESPSSTRVEFYDTIVVGGGQAGLAAGYHLAQKDIDFLILDANDRVGDSWRKRWDSLQLFTPARYSGLPGLSFPGSSLSPTRTRSEITSSAMESTSTSRCDLARG